MTTIPDGIKAIHLNVTTNTNGAVKTNAKRISCNKCVNATGTGVVATLYPARVAASVSSKVWYTSNAARSHTFTHVHTRFRVCADAQQLFGFEDTRTDTSTVWECL